MRLWPGSDLTPVEEANSLPRGRGPLLASDPLPSQPRVGVGAAATAVKRLPRPEIVDEVFRRNERLVATPPLSHRAESVDASLHAEKPHRAAKQLAAAAAFESYEAF